MIWILAAAGIVVGFSLCWAIMTARAPRVASHNPEATLDKIEQRLKLQFENTANTIFETMSNKFSTQSEKKIGDLLMPLRERLTEFQKKVDDSFGAHGKEQHTLKAEIEKIARMNDSLTRALRGDVKAQGNWGEVMLERILEEAGLRAGIDYIIQAADMNLVAADGTRQRPDIIVKLPGDKHVIIDAKVSLTAYERYCATQEDAQRTTHLKDFLRSVRGHVNGLSEKRYQDNDQLGTPDVVLMFMPIEGAYSLAIQQDVELHNYAWGRKIAIICPSTLFVNLQTIASLWRMDAQNKNALEIARQSGAMYDKFVGFVDDLKNVGTHMTRATDSYDKAMNKLSEGRGNLVSGVEKLKTLGAKTSKSMPVEVKDDEDAPLKIVTS